MGEALTRYRQLKVLLRSIDEDIQALNVRLYGSEKPDKEAEYVMPPTTYRDKCETQLKELAKTRSGYRKERRELQEQAAKEREQEKRLNLAKKRAKKKQYEQDRLSGKAFINRFNGPAKFKASQPKKGKIKSESIETKNSVRTLSAGTGNW